MSVLVEGNGMDWRFKDHERCWYAQLARENILSMMLDARGYHDTPRNKTGIMDLYEFRKLFMIAEKQRVSEFIWHPLSLFAQKTLEPPVEMRASMNMPKITDVIHALLHIKKGDTNAIRMEISDDLSVKRHELCLLYDKGGVEGIDENGEENVIEKDEHGVEWRELRIPQMLPDEVVVVYCFTKGAFGKAPLDQICKFQEVIDNKHMIVLLCNVNGNNVNKDLTSYPRSRDIVERMKLPTPENHYRRIEFHSLLNMTISLTQSQFHTPLKKLTDQESSIFLNRVGIVPEKLNVLLQDDPIVRWYDFQKNDIVTNIRHDGSTNVYMVGVDK